jgi:exodeoxyribonuclease VII large subunit
MSVNTAKTSMKLQPVLTVGALTARIRAVLEERFDQVAVKGEISNARVHSSGHWYFSLKDEDACISCICYRSTASGIKFALEDGLQVVAYGRVSVYAPKGDYQLVVSALEPIGVGAAQLAFEQLRGRLQSEGLLEPTRKRTIPLIPRKIGVVTSLQAAALQDIITAIKRRNKSVSMVICPAKVQGDGSAEEVARAISDIQTIDDLDVLIVARGGGSIEDLWSFNTEVVARAVAQCRVPVISGVGHETDVTICDLVADLRAPTPTAAAEMVAKGHAEILDRWSKLTRLLVSSIEQKVLRVRRQVERLDPRKPLAAHVEKFNRLLSSFHNKRDRMLRQVSVVVAQSTSNWHKRHEKLDALSPLKVLERGFAIVRRDDGSIVRDAAAVSPGEQLDVFLHRGKLRAWITSQDKTTAIERGKQDD